MASVQGLYNKELEINKNLKELDQKINDYKKFAQELEKSLQGGSIGFVENYANQLRSITDDELGRFWVRLSQANPDAMFLAACVDNMLNVLERHKVDKNKEAVIIATINCASYQMWQKIKADAWGKNETKVRM